MLIENDYISYIENQLSKSFFFSKFCNYFILLFYTQTLTGQVFLGTQKSDNKQYAVKVIDLDEEDLEELQQEIRFLSELKSPFVVEYFGWYLKDDKLHIVMEYIGSGSILEQVQK